MAVRYFWTTIVLLSTLVGGDAVAQQAHVAVATNFRIVAEHLAQSYAGQSDQEVIIASGSTGKLYTQITHGAPYDLFLAADQERPRRLVDEGLAVASSLQTYATGQLVLVGQNPVSQARLELGQYRSLAIANPKLAPYGLAANETLEHLKIRESVYDKLVLGENVGQAYALVATGNAELGLVARSLLHSDVRLADTMQTWLIPQDHHSPIHQDLVLLNRGAQNTVAKNFMAFILSPTGQTMINDAGYGHL